MKWIGVLVAGLFVIFGVAAGILAIMGGLDNEGISEAKTEINAPIALVFEWVTETTHTPRWVRRLKTSSPITKGDLKPEAMIREVITTPKGTYEITGTFTEFDPPNRATVEYTITGWTPKGGKLVPKKAGDEPVTKVVSTFELTKVDQEKTALSYHVHTEYNGVFMRFMEPMSTYGGTKSMESNLIDLTSRVEAEHEREKKRALKAAERNAEKEKKRKAKLKKQKNKKEIDTKPSGNTTDTKPSGNIDVHRNNLLKAITPTEFKPILPDKDR